MLLVVALSFGTAFATSEQTAESGQEASQSTATSATTTAEAQPVSHIIKKGKNYYYKKSNGKIRKKKGFVTDLGNLYYVKKGGKIVRNKTFKIKKKTYRAYKNGVIATGVYQWKGKYYYANSSGKLIKKEKVVYWNGNAYFINKKGIVQMNTAVSYKNVPYRAGADGVLTPLAIPDGGGNPVVAIAKNQVGIMTGKTYWRWYFGTKFRDTDRTPWCGAFVAWCYNAAGQYDKVTSVHRFGSLGYVPSYSRYANNYGKWVARTAAMPGDIIVFGKNRHVGLVEGISGDCIITIEGNAGPTAAIGCGKPGAVVRKAYLISSSDIKGIIRVN